jgi:hypothetical protein
MISNNRNTISVSQEWHLPVINICIDGVTLVRTDVSEELSASFIRVTRIGELGTTLAVISNRRDVRRL